MEEDGQRRDGEWRGGERRKGKSSLESWQYFAINSHSQFVTPALSSSCGLGCVPPVLSTLGGPICTFIRMLIVLLGYHSSGHRIQTAYNFCQQEVNAVFFFFTCQLCFSSFFFFSPSEYNGTYRDRKINVGTIITAS